MRIKHRLEIDECRIKQQREELTLRMRRANISIEYLPTMTASMNKHVCENYSKTNNTDAAVNVTLTKNAREVALAAMGEDNRSLVDALMKGQEQQSKLVATLHMPKIELQVFDSNPLQFWSFLRLFETSVQCHADDIDKITRLVQCTTGKARRAMQRCAYMNPSKGYKKAMQILKDIFGSNDYISQA